LNLCSLANENRYEGTWRDDKKNGPGKYYYLTHGQMYEGTHYTYTVFIKSLNYIQEKARKKHVVCSFIIVITKFFLSFSPYV